MLDFHPERIGHACFFDEEHWKRMKASKIPVRHILQVFSHRWWTKLIYFGFHIQYLSHPPCELCFSEIVKRRRNIFFILYLHICRWRYA